MKLIIAIWNYLFPGKPKRSKLLAPLVDSRYEKPAYKNIPEQLLRILSNPAYRRETPYQDGYYGPISGELIMRKFQGKLFGKLKRQSGVSPEEYKSYLEPILLAYAELVHLLPASQHHHHNNPSGLLRHGLETACFMLDWMVLTKFDHELTPGAASMRLRRWYVAGIIAALFHDAGKPLTDMRVLNFEGDKEWLMGRLTIHEWAVANNITEYFITWIKGRDQKHKMHTALLIGTFVTAEIREWLIEGGRDIWDALISATSDQPGPLTRAVKVADSRSVKADRQLCGSTNGGTAGSHSIQHLCVDTMRFLANHGTWTFNNPGSRLWKTTEGVFLAWSTGSQEIIQHVTRDSASNFPRTDASLLAAMSERELIERDANGSMIWFVAPHVLKKNGAVPSLRCVKLQRPEEIFPDTLDELAPVSATIGRGDEARNYPASSTAGGLAKPAPHDLCLPIHSPAQRAPLVIPPKFAGSLSSEHADYLRTYPALGSRLLTELERNSKVIELQNRVFLPLTGLINESDLSALAEAGWLWPNLASTTGEFTRTHRGQTGALLNTRLSLIFCQLTNAPWQPRCPATLPKELRSQVLRQAMSIRAFAVEDLGRGAKTCSLSFWARDKYQKANELSGEEVEHAILFGLEAVKVSNERKYYFAADLEFEV